MDLDKTKQDMESGLEHAVRVVQTRFAESVFDSFCICTWYTIASQMPTWIQRDQWGKKALQLR